jgi:hypothetical protein
MLLPDITSLPRASRIRAWSCICGGWVLLVGGVMAPAMSVAGADTAQAYACNVRIILGLAQAMQPPPSDQWVLDLAAANGVTLHYLRAITPQLYLFRMTATDAAGGCSAPMARLRRDPRLRSVEFDQLRKHDAG